MEPLKEMRRAEGGTGSGRRAGALATSRRVNATARKAAHTQFTILLHYADIEALVRIRLRMPRCLPNFLQSLTWTRGLVADVRQWSRADGAAISFIKLAFDHCGIHKWRTREAIFKVLYKARKEGEVLF